MREIADGLERTLADLGTPERAASEQRYLKSDLTFLGATVWQTERVVKDHLAGRHLTHDDAVDLAVELWSVAVFERRTAAVMILKRSASVLTAADLSLLERFVRESRTWALVDGLAGDVVGRIVEADPGRAAPVLDRWARDPDFWVRRASLLGELRGLRTGAPLDRFVARADPMLEEREFFIRKAIGWILREVSKKRPDLTFVFLRENLGKVSGLTLREGAKYLPASQRRELGLAPRT